MQTLHGESNLPDPPFPHSKQAEASAPARAAVRAQAAVGPVDRCSPGIAEFAQGAPRSTACQERLSRPHWIWFAAALAAVLMVATPVIYSLWRRANAQSVPGTSSDLLLKVSREPRNALRLSWNRDSPAVRNAVSGVLLISDAGRPIRVDLDKKLLSQGSIVYFPTSGDVDFRVEVSANGLGVVESVRSVVPLPMAPQPPLDWSYAPSMPLPVEQPETLAGESVARVEQPGNPPELQPQERARNRRSSAMPQREEVIAKAPTKHFQPDALKATAGLARSTPALVLAPPTVPEPSPIGKPPDLLARSHIAATVAYEPVEPSTLQRIVHRIPGLGRLERLQGNDNKDFVPPRPLNEISFVAPPTNDRGLLKQTPIALKISLNESGKISHVQLLPDSKNNPAANLALRASLAWQFVPALWKGKAVASEVIVRLTFDGNSRSASMHTRRPTKGTSGPMNSKTE